MPAIACLRGHCWLCSSDLCEPLQIWHLTESLLSVQALEVLLCPSTWHFEHCTNAGLSIHFWMVTSLPNSAVLPLSSVFEMVASGSDTANMIDE